MVGRRFLFTTLFFMEIAGTIANLLTEKDSQIWSIKPDATVYEAIEFMAAKNIGALPVLDGQKLLGILSERDYTRKVILKGKSSKSTLVQEIMSKHPATVGLSETVGDCMRLMTEKRVRHLPVLKDGDLVGILSIGDVVKWVISAQTATIDQLTKYIYGE
jgi:CBS domain-containing protein